MTILLKLVPFFTLMAAGGVLARLRVLEDGHVRGLSRYVLWLGFPALLLHLLSTVRPLEAAEHVWLAAYALGAAAPYLIGAALSRLKPLQGGAAMLPLACGAGNDAFLTLPFCDVLGRS